MSLTSFGIYIHIPYCIQRCTYCDFATYEQSKIIPLDSYVELLIKEISLKKNFFLRNSNEKLVNTIYFGGGTPSLLSIDNILLILNSLAREGFISGPEVEKTIEVNPGTVDEKKLEQLLKLGFNRFSVGAQTFNPQHLKRVHREHSVEQTVETLNLLKKHQLNFNFDLLFGLPHQTLDELKFDLFKTMEFQAPHISPYYLTVPNGHPLSKNRPLEDEQLEMFKLINENLIQAGYRQYEISNYSHPNFESKHNRLYWTDQEYWGLGLSSHSYSKINYLQKTPWGTRFWNPNNIKIYEEEINSAYAQADMQKNEGSRTLTSRGLLSPLDLEQRYHEVLLQNQSLTDYCHTFLRTAEGVAIDKLKLKFETVFQEKAISRLVQLELRHLVSYDAVNNAYTLSQNGKMISNLVFEKLTF